MAADGGGEGGAGRSGKGGRWATRLAASEAATGRVAAGEEMGVREEGATGRKTNRVRVTRSSTARYHAPFLKPSSVHHYQCVTRATTKIRLVLMGF